MRRPGWICTELALIFPIVSLELRVIANIGGIESAAKGKKHLTVVLAVATVMKDVVMIPFC
jgi:hypothetical protein